MDQVRWRQVDDILLAALELLPAERTSFVERACADDERLREEVISLLSFDAGALDIIDTPALETAACILAPDRAELAEGQSVSHYRILSLLGAGGMGEVYLAEDTKLGRNIALKLLPADFTRDRDRVHRFQREGRAASALNHPNIITIHETGEFEDKHFIATEFISGETLRQRMRRERLDLGEVLDIAMQVANALAAAHQAGIIHRDIKPENIMLRPDGYVKVLDFGLAKAAKGESFNRESAEAPADDTDTTSGLLLGTAKYMSPEQAGGLALDARSDIFSLGVVIYEMVTGRQPFHGSTPSHVIASLLKEDPPPLSRDAPDGLKRIVGKSLSKDKDQRYQSAEDMLADLRDLRRRLETQSDYVRTAADSSSASDPDSASPRALKSFSNVVDEIRQHRSWAAIILAGLALVTVGLIAVFRFAAASKGAAAFQNIAVTQLNSNGVVRDAAISPDGKYVAYVVEEPAQETIWIKQVATDNAVQLVPPGAERLAAPTFSRDGNYLFYVRYEKGGGDTNELYYHGRGNANALWQMSVLGGPARRIITKVHSPISFSPDGKRFAFIRRYQDRNALLVANSDGAEERELISRGDPDQLYDYPCGPAWSPDGRVVFCASGNYGLPTAFIEVGADNGQERVVPAGTWWPGGLAWLSDGSGLLMSAMKEGHPPFEHSEIWHISYPGLEVRPITNGLVSYSGISVTADASVIATTQGFYRYEIWVIPGEDPAKARVINSSANTCEGVSWTPDGRIVYSQTRKDGADIWTMNQDGTNREQLTFNSGANTHPSVSPHGDFITFSSIVLGRSGSGSIWRMGIDGRDPKQLAGGIGFPISTCSSDGRWALFMDSVSSIRQWWRVSVDGGDPVRLPGDEEMLWPSISPDGKLIAYLYDDSDADPPYGIGIMPFEGGKVIKRFSTPTRNKYPWNNYITWSRDGQALLYNTPDIWRQPLDGSPPKQITDFHGDDIPWYDWSPDGGQLVCVRMIPTSYNVLISDKK